MGARHALDARGRRATQAGSWVIAPLDRRASARGRDRRRQHNTRWDPVFYRQFDPAKARPKEYELTFEASLGTTLRQPVFNPYGSYGPGTFKDRADIWYVAEDGSNLTDTIEDAASCLLTQGLPFLDKMSDPARAFEALRTEDSNNGYDTYGSLGVTMPGAPGSPHWQEVAWAIGRMVMDDPSDAIRTAPSVLEDERRRARRRASD